MFHCICIYIMIILHSSVDGYLGFSVSWLLWIIIHNMDYYLYPMNMGVQIFLKGTEEIYSRENDIYPK